MVLHRLRVDVVTLFNWSVHGRFIYSVTVETTCLRTKNGFAKTIIVPIPEASRTSTWYAQRDLSVDPNHSIDLFRTSAGIRLGHRWYALERVTAGRWTDQTLAATRFPFDNGSLFVFFFGPEKRTRLYVLFSITARRDQGVKYANAVKTVRRKLFALRPFVVRDARPIPYDYRAIPI